MMIGQSKIKEWVRSLNIDSLPHSLLICGESGSGKHSIIKLIIDKININLINLDKIDKDIIEFMYTSVEPTLYVIDLNSIDLKKENIILKVLEEPNKNIYIVITCENKSNIIPTILNRCFLIDVEPYKIEELSTFLFSDDEKCLVDVFKTPGKLIYAIDHKNMVYDIMKFSDIFIDHICTANFSNSLTISNKISFKKDSEGWDFDIFFQILLYKIKLKLVENYSNLLYNLYIITDRLMYEKSILHINKEHLFENYLVNCKLLNIR